MLFTTQPGVGHLHPLVPVADGLRARGHDVRVASSRSFGAEITAAGHVPVAVGRDWLATAMPEAFPEITAIPPGPERYAWARATLFAGHTARACAGDIAAHASAWGADLVVRDAAEYGGCLAAERCGLPHAVVRTDSGSSSFADRTLVAGPLDAARAELGLPPDPDAAMAFRYLQLSFAPAGLDEAPEDQAPTCHLLRPPPPPTSGGSGGEAPAWLDALDDRPVVYATLGTVYNRDVGLLEAILAALEPEPVQLVVTLGGGHDPQRFGPRPPHVHIHRWIPQHHIIPRCSAVITHGGYGTVSAALAAGVPLVLVPISADQPLNAARCAARGTGIVVDATRRTPDALRAATRAVLDDPSFAHAARAAADASARRPDVGHALDLLERVARERAPIPALRGVAAP